MSISANLRRRLAIALADTGARDELASALGLLTYGQVFYVSADLDAQSKPKGNANNNGLSMDQPKATIPQAMALCTSGNHDAIVLTGNTGHTLDDELVISKSRVHIFGTGFRGGAHQGQRSRLSLGVSSGSAISAIKITGVGVTLNDLKISSADTLSTSLYSVADGGEFTILRNCWLEKSTDLDQTGAAELLANGDTSSYIGCTFGNMIYRPSVARQNVLLTRETITGKVCRASEFIDCGFLGFPSATSFSHFRGTTNDIERFVNLIECRMLSKVGGSIAAEAITVGSAFTDGGIYIQGGLTNATNTATASSGVFTNLAASHADGGRVTEVT